MGFYAMRNTNIGVENTAIGSNAMQFNTTGNSNTALGNYALLLNNGNNNVGIGDYAGMNLTVGNRNIFIGYNVQPNIANNASNQLNIGNWIYGDNGNIGIGVSNPVAKLEVNGQIKIMGGSPGTGYVLVSDATGLASWQA